MSEDKYLINSPEFKRVNKLLGSSILELEDVILDKIQEKKEQNDGHEIVIENSHEDSFAIQNLNKEINNLQNSLAELGKENEVLLEENRVLFYKIATIKKHAPDIARKVEADLAKIKNILQEE